MSAVMKEPFNIEHVRSMLRLWGFYQNDMTSPMPGRHCRKASHLAIPGGGGCSDYAEPSDAVQRIELELCCLKRFDERAYVAVAASYTARENESDASISARLRISERTLRNRRYTGEYYVAARLMRA